jgi:hypothetical protein
MSEEIIAYRVGDHFLCPKHYQISVRILSVHDIELPAQPIKDGEIESFVCDQCKDIDKPKNRDEERKVVYLRERIDPVGLLDKVDSAMKHFIESEERARTETDMIGEIAKISRRAKFIQKTLHLAWEGHHLSRKNIATLRQFFNDLGQKLDTLRTMITMDVLTSIDYRKILAEQGRRNFCVLRSEEQKILRIRFGSTEKYSQEQKDITGETARY